MMYICTGDKTQIWKKISIWFKSRENSMSRVKRVNNSNQDPRTKKIFSHDLNQTFMIWVMWFKSIYDSNQDYIIKIQNLLPQFYSSQAFLWFKSKHIWFESCFTVIRIKLREAKFYFSEPCLIRFIASCDLN